MVSNTRLYGAAIAFASGLYSIWSASLTSRMTTSAWLMLLLGVIVLLHGVALLTAYADRFGDASGPLMVAYALVMLLNQALLGTEMMGDGTPMGTADSMGTTGGMGGSQLTAGMGWDAGMVALAALMLASGIIMTRNGGSRDGRSRGDGGM